VQQGVGGCRQPFRLDLATFAVLEVRQYPGSFVARQDAKSQLGQ
jgi:hypothetical protein